jgi:type VI protein secretion system component Hcp
MTLDLGPSGRQIPINSFSWGFAGTGGGTKKDQPLASDFSFTTDAGVATPGLTSGTFGKASDAVLITRDRYGHVLTRWQLDEALFSSYSTGGAAGGGTPTESFTLNFTKLTLVYNDLAPAAAVDAIAPAARNNTVGTATIRFSEPVTGFDWKDLKLTRGASSTNLLTAQQTLTTSDGGRTWTLGNLAALQGPDGQYVLSVLTGAATEVYGTSSGQALAQSTAGLWTLDRVAPTIVSSAFDYGASPQRVRVTFSEDVGASLAREDLVSQPYTGAGAGPALPPVQSVDYDPQTRSATWTFASRLPDGNYRVGLANSAVGDPAGNALAAPLVLEFYVLGGDATRDRKVDFNDLVKLAQNYNSPAGKAYDEGDFDGDGRVDFSDLVILAQHYNTALAKAAGSAVPIAGAAPMPALAPVIAAESAKTKTEKTGKPIFSATPVAKPAPAKAKAPVRRR